jgi:hypothetical protein
MASNSYVLVARERAAEALLQRTHSEPSLQGITVTIDDGLPAVVPTQV